MRVVRVLVGMLTLLLAVPVLGAGALAWWVMQHRSPDGTFRAQLSEIDAPGRIVVVPDVDALLHRDAPIARADQTELRLTVANGGFIGMAAPADLAAYLAGVNYTELVQTKLGQGPLAVQVRQVTSTGEVPAPVETQHFWVRSAAGQLRWSPAADRDHHVALIVIAPPGDGPIRLNVALTAGWLNSTTWGLLILGPVLLLLGLAALAWPQRPREIVYVVDGDTAARAGLPTPTFAAALPRSAIPPTTWDGRAPGVVAPRMTGGVVPQPARAPDAQTGEPAVWPPSEPDDETQAPRYVRTLADDLFGVPPRAHDDTDEIPLLPEDLPMPTAGMHLHLSKPKR